MKVDEKIYSTLFHSNIQSQNEVGIDITDILAVMKDEIEEAQGNVKKEKAPGEDDIKVDILKDASEKLPLKNYQNFSLYVSRREKCCLEKCLRHEKSKFSKQFTVSYLQSIYRNKKN